MAGLYDIAKDAATMAMNLQNFELTQKLLEVQRQAMEMQEENSKLKEEVRQLRDIKELEERIKRYSKTFISLKGDEQQIMYCSVCWDDKNKLIQMSDKAERKNDSIISLEYKCHICPNRASHKLSVPL